MVDANLEIVRNGAGEVTELRNVWRFDELFSTTVVMDYDANGNNVLEPEELAEVSKTVTKSISEEEFFTEVRLGKDRSSSCRRRRSWWIMSTGRY